MSSPATDDHDDLDFVEQIGAQYGLTPAEVRIANDSGLTLEEYAGLKAGTWPTPIRKTS